MEISTLNDILNFKEFPYTTTSVIQWHESVNLLLESGLLEEKRKSRPATVQDDRIHLC